jgi:hypothetical protein
MLTALDKEGSTGNFAQLLDEMDAHENVKSILIFACDANQFDPDQVDHHLQGAQSIIFGGIFPEILYEGKNYSRGTLLVGLPVAPELLVIPGLSDPSADYDDIIEREFDRLSVGRTMFVWVDGLSSRISALIDALFNVFGLEQNYIGGGAGSLSFEQKPCLFTNQGLIADSALLALVDIESGIGVSHGWLPLSGPYRVTESESNVIKSLNWEPAFKIYQGVVEQASGKLFNDGNFFELAKAHPFGINRLGEEQIVRDPILVDDQGGLICVGEVPVESYVDILFGSTDSLIYAAGNALHLAEEAYVGNPEQTVTLFIDCISRVLFLEEDFRLELAAVARENRTMIGALTLGEIANSGKDYLEFYNKTSVVGILEA